MNPLATLRRFRPGVLAAAFAPILSGYLGSHYGTGTPFFLATALVAVAVLGLLARGDVLRGAAHGPEDAATAD